MLTPGGGLPSHDGEIRHYRLDGVFLGSFPTTGFPGDSYTLAANEHALCMVNGISRDDGIFTGVVYDLSGTLVTTVPLMFSEGCALTQDRVFFGNQPSYPNWEVGVYDMQGQKQLTVPIAGAVYGVHGLAATEERLYVATRYIDGSSAILIYERHVVRDGVGNIVSDTFIYASKVDVEIGVQAYYPTLDRARFLK